MAHFEDSSSNALFACAISYNLLCIIEYNPQWQKDAEDLLVELEEYLVSIDKDHLDRLSDDYRQKMLEYDLRDVAENNGKCYLAVINDTVVGMIMGILRNYSDMDHLDYLCPKTGIITELIVKTEYRYHSIGQTLMRAIETYFLEIGCEYVLVDVFAYNTSAQRFYEKEGYHARMIKAIKKINISGRND